MRGTCGLFDMSQSVVKSCQGDRPRVVSARRFASWHPKRMIHQT